MRMWKPTWSDILKTLVHQVECRFRWLRAVTKRSLRLTAPVKILPYRGYGSQQQIFLMGRVVEDRPVGSPREEGTWWQNVKAMYRRFVIDEIPDVRIRATVGAQSVETTTDAYGYFRLSMTPSDPVDSEGEWPSVVRHIARNRASASSGVDVSVDRDIDSRAIENSCGHAW